MGDTRTILILGAGPAGLTAGKLLIGAGLAPSVFESDSQVGGLAKTVNFKGYRFDIGGHRFFTKMGWVQSFWEECLGEDLISVPRLSRLYYQGKFFQYPLRPMNALIRLGPFQSFKVVLSYLKAHVFPADSEDFLEGYVINRFGRELYEIFFKEYTEKVWGLPCSEIRSEWAAQRIKGLSLSAAVLDALGLNRRNVKSLIDRFYYPRLGPGMLWEKVQQRIDNGGGRVHLNSKVVKIHHDHTRVQGILIETTTGLHRVEGTDFISSLPIRSLIRFLEPAPPPSIQEAARSLHYRDLITVNLIVRCAGLFPDNWIYVHSPAVKVARIQNFKNWSADMVPEHSTTALSLEYFCSKGDKVWELSDAELIELAKEDLRLTGLASPSQVEDGFVYREVKAYPVYNSEYCERLAMIRGYLSQFANLQLIGRNGLHKYNNQDHSMLCAKLAVENLFGASHEIWDVNNDDVYQEEILAGGSDVKNVKAWGKRCWNPGP